MLGKQQNLAWPNRKEKKVKSQARVSAGERLGPTRGPLRWDFRGRLARLQEGLFSSLARFPIAPTFSATRIPPHTPRPSCPPFSRSIPASDTATSLADILSAFPFFLPPLSPTSPVVPCRPRTSSSHLAALAFTQSVPLPPHPLLIAFSCSSTAPCISATLASRCHPCDFAPLSALSRLHRPLSQSINPPSHPPSLPFYPAPILGRIHPHSA